MAFKHVAVLMGGASEEREISLRSGKAAWRGLLECGYDAVAVDVVGRDVSLPSGTEAVFIALHGTFGEDGAVQSILEQMRIPYTGSGVVASRIAMDKCLTKRACDAASVPTPTYQILQRGDTCHFPLPLVVKPASQGSSVGLHLVREASQLAAALDDAFGYDDCVLVEAYIPGRELTVGIIDRETLPVVEIAAPGGWYDFAAKYTSGETQYTCPAELPTSVWQEAQRLALAAFDALGCEGVGRVDFRLSPNGELYVLELNSIPGLTETSLLPKAAAAAGIPFVTLCDRLMQTARCKGDSEEAGHGRL